MIVWKIEVFEFGKRHAGKSIKTYSRKDKQQQSDKEDQNKNDDDKDDIANNEGNDENDDAIKELHGLQSDFVFEFVQLFAYYFEKENNF